MWGGGDEKVGAATGKGWGDMKKKYFSLFTVSDYLRSLNIKTKTTPFNGHVRKNKFFYAFHNKVEGHFPVGFGMKIKSYSSGFSCALYS